MTLHWRDYKPGHGLKSISICTGARWWRRGLGPDNRSEGALLFHCRDDIGRWEWENAVCTATVWREGDRRGCHGRAWRHYCNKAKIIRTQIEVFTANTEKESDRALPLKIYIEIYIYKKNIYKKIKMKCLGLATLWITGKLFCVGLLLRIAQSNFYFGFFLSYFVLFVLFFFFFSIWDCILAQTDQFVIFIFTSSLQSHPSFYPVADNRGNQNNARSWFCSKYESIWWCVTKNRHLLP